ncbi:hypothetical protein EKH55_3500 [Sinorhizobium alkalisoli]|nr:hypothetical protein EKH55_3500 [Sinorhizobium alkalisoli]
MLTGAEIRHFRRVPRRWDKPANSKDREGTVTGKHGFLKVRTR